MSRWRARRRTFSAEASTHHYQSPKAVAIGDFKWKISGYLWGAAVLNLIVEIRVREREQALKDFWVMLFKLRNQTSLGFGERLADLTANHRAYMLDQCKWACVWLNHVTEYSNLLLSFHERCHIINLLKVKKNEMTNLFFFFWEERGGVPDSCTFFFWETEPGISIKLKLEYNRTQQQGKKKQANTESNFDPI